MANKFFGAIGLIGGTDGMLDDIEDTVISDIDSALVITDAQLMYTFNCDSGSGAAEDSPRLIAPDSGSNKRWLLNSIIATSFYIYENAEYLYGVTAGDSETGILRINSSDDTEIRAATGQSVDVIINTTKIADFSAALTTFYAKAAETGMTITGDAGVALYYDNTKKFETTTVGTLTTGGIYLVEQAAAGADTATHGQLWVKTATPCELWFTDDAGTDTQIV